MSGKKRHARVRYESTVCLRFPELQQSEGARNFVAMGAGDDDGAARAIPCHTGENGKAEVEALHFADFAQLELRAAVGKRLIAAGKFPDAFGIAARHRLGAILAALQGARDGALVGVFEVRAGG